MTAVRNYTERRLREHPILFSGPMVRALLSGAKTQTRRVVTPHTCDVERGLWAQLDWSRVFVDPGLGGGQYLKVGGPDDTIHRVRCRWSIGDRLWVRETWARAPFGVGGAVYRADFAGAEGTVSDDLDVRWAPSIHMPRWASRLTLEITDVRVERLSEITDEAALAEGVEYWSGVASGLPTRLTPCEQFEGLWDAINAKRGFGWDVNPYVWVLSFRRAA